MPTATLDPVPQLDLKSIIESTQPVSSTPAPAPVPTTAPVAGGLIQSTAAQAPAPTTYDVAAPTSLQAYSPTIRDVYAPNETVQGQLDSILAKDSPLMQRARTLATQQMAQRGLVNSSMAAGATEAALIDRATPIAAADANTYANRSTAIMNAQNEAQQFNVGQSNNMYLQQAQQKFQAAQAELDRAQQTFLADKSIAAQQALQAAQQVFQAAQSELDRANQLSVAQLQIGAQTSLQGAQLAAQASMQSSQLAFQATQAQLDRANQLSLLQLQNTLNQGNVSTNFAATIGQNTLTTIQQIQLDPNLSPEAKQAAVANAIAAANSTLSWSSTLYNTTMPTLSLPGTTSGTTSTSTATPTAPPLPPTSDPVLIGNSYLPSGTQTVSAGGGWYDVLDASGNPIGVLQPGGSNGIFTPLPTYSGTVGGGN